MKRVVYILFTLWGLSAAVSVSAQQPENPDAPAIGREEGMAIHDYDDLDGLPDISKWLPVEQFARELQAQQMSRFAPTEFSTSMVIPKRPKRFVVISPDNNTIKFGSSFSISNGSAGNWGVPYPSAFLDARTLSFPVPR